MTLINQPISINVEKIYLETERKVINLMLQHREIISEMLDSNLSPTFFHVQHRPLVQAIYYTYQVSEGKRLLTDEHYRALLIEQGGKGEISIAMQVYHECMHGVHFSNSKEDFDLLKRQLIDSFVHNRTVTALKVLNDNLLKLGRLEATRQLHADIADAINLSDTKKSTSFLMLDELKDDYIEQLQNKIEDKEEKITCQIPEIDEAMSVGFRPGMSTLIIAPPGGHKTNLMINIAINIFSKGKNVLFLPLEMDWQELTNRIISNLTKISYTKILNPQSLNADEYKQIKQSKAWISQNNKFALLDVNELISISVLTRELEKRTNYFKPNLVVVDYLGLLKTNKSYGERHDLALGELTKHLKFLGKKHGFHVLTAAQLGRADIKRLREQGPEAQLDSTSIRGSQEVPADIEFIFGLTRPPDEEDRIKLHKIKSRYGPAGSSVDLHLNADTCQIVSMKPVVGGTSVDVLGEDWLNEPQQEIAAKISQQTQSKPVVFDSMNPDDLDDIETV